MPRVPWTKKPAISSTSASSTTSSTSGKEPQGAGGRSRRPLRRLGAGAERALAGRLAWDGWRSLPAWGLVVRTALAPPAPLRRHSLAGPTVTLGGFGVAASGPRPWSHGQPDEILTRHQPISIPIRPQRGRECQNLQPGSPMSSLEIRTHLKRAGSAIRASMRPRLPLPRRRRAHAARGGCPRRGRQARRAAPRGRRHPSRRGPPGERTRHSKPLRGYADANSAACSRSRRAICSRSERRAAASSTSVRRRSTAGTAADGSRSSRPS